MVHTEEWKKTWKLPEIKHNVLTKHHWLVQYPENLKMGKYIDIGEFTYINARFGVIIEDDVEIGGGCHIYSHDTIGNKMGKVILEERCKIGSHSIILPGVTVGKGAVVGAMSLVKRDVDAGSTVAGIPASQTPTCRYVSSDYPLGKYEI